MENPKQSICEIRSTFDELVVVQLYDFTILKPKWWVYVTIFKFLFGLTFSKEIKMIAIIIDILVFTRANISNLENTLIQSELNC